MTTELSFDRMLELVEGRSAAVRSALAGALGERVPGCPDWTGRDLIAHLGEVQRFWAQAVVAGKPEIAPRDDDVPEREPGGDLLDWSERSTGTLLDALRQAGPDRPVWSWWSPTTAARVARHQVQEAGVHAWDAEDTIGRGGVLLPADLAADGIEEFLSVEVPTNGAWPHPPATVGLTATDVPGAGWRVALAAAGGTVETGAATGNAVLGGTASDLILALYGRRPADRLAVTGDQEVARRFLAWFTTQ
jgi:uncharacterized protein (TIGR03083 family)